MAIPAVGVGGYLLYRWYKTKAAVAPIAPPPTVAPPAVPVPPVPMKTLTIRARKFAGAGAYSTLRVLADGNPVGEIKVYADQPEQPFTFSVPATVKTIRLEPVEVPSAVVVTKFPTLDGASLAAYTGNFYEDSPTRWVIGSGNWLEIKVATMAEEIPRVGYY